MYITTLFSQKSLHLGVYLPKDHNGIYDPSFMPNITIFNYITFPKNLYTRERIKSTALPTVKIIRVSRDTGVYTFPGDVQIIYITPPIATQIFSLYCTCMAMQLQLLHV